MSQVFISHVEEDWDVVSAIAGALERAGFSAWYYERDSIPGPPYLDQVYEAINQCEAVLLVISQESMRSHQVDAEVVLAFETRKPFVPLLSGITHPEFQKQKPSWRLALGAATSVAVPKYGIDTILDRIIAGAKELGLQPTHARERVDSPVPVVSADASEGDTVECSLFAPPKIGPDEAVLAHAWLHTEAQANAVTRSSAEFDESVELRGRAAISPALSVGTQFELGLKIGKLPVRSLSTGVTWQGEPEAIIFRVGPPLHEILSPETSSGDHAGIRPQSTEIGELVLSRDDLIVGTVKFKLELASESVAAVSGKEVAGRRKAFLCYAQNDRAEVLRRAQMLALVGMESFVDMLSLSPGEEWERQTMRAIEEADVFMLFWSTAAKQSKWVEREWRYALKTKGLEFIVPIGMETPLPTPPPELAHLHFAPSLAYVGGG